MFKTIVWATDGSASADLALAQATTLAAEQGASLLAVHCVEYVVGPHSGGVTVHPDEEALRAKIERQVAELSAQGIDVSERVVGGTTVTGAAHVIADVAREAGADLIVTGTRGHTTLVGLLLGSVTERLLHIAPCPVLVVPAVPATAAGEQHATAVASA